MNYYEIEQKRQQEETRRRQERAAHEAEERARQEAEARAKQEQAARQQAEERARQEREAQQREANRRASEEALRREQERIARETEEQRQRQERERREQQAGAERQARQAEAVRQQEELQREQVRQAGENYLRAQEAANQASSRPVNVLAPGAAVPGGVLPANISQRGYEVTPLSPEERLTVNIPSGARVAETNAQGVVITYEKDGVRYYTPDNVMWKMGYRTDQEYYSPGQAGSSPAIPGIGLLYVDTPYVPIVTGAGVMHITRAEYNKLVEIADPDARMAQLKALIGIDEGVPVLARDDRLSDLSRGGKLNLTAAVEAGITEPTDFDAAGFTLNLRDIGIQAQKVAERKGQAKKYEEVMQFLRPFADEKGNIDLVAAGQAINEGDTAVERALHFMNISRKDAVEAERQSTSLQNQIRSERQSTSLQNQIRSEQEKLIQSYVKLTEDNKDNTLRRSLAPYKTDEGGYDLAKYLRDNPGTESSLRDFGFSKADIDKSKEYNKNVLGVGWKKWERSDFIERYFRAKGWEYSPATAFVGAGSDFITDEKQRKFAERIEEANKAYQRDYGVKNTYAEFERAYFHDKGWIHPDDIPTYFEERDIDINPAALPVPGQDMKEYNRAVAAYSEMSKKELAELQKQTANFTQRQMEALDEYIKRFGVEPVINQSLTNVADFVVPGYYVSRNWTKLSTTEKAVNIAIDVLFVGSLFAKPAAAGFRQVGRVIGETSAKGLNAVANRIAEAVRAGDVARVRAIGQSMVEAGSKLTGKLTGTVGNSLVRNGKNLIALADDYKALATVKNPSFRQAVQKLRANATVAGLGGEGGYLRMDELLRRPINREAPRIKPGERVRVGEYIISRDEAEAAARSTGRSVEEIEDILRRTGNDRQAFDREIANLGSRKQAFDELNRAIEELKEKTSKDELRKWISDSENTERSGYHRDPENKAALDRGHYGEWDVVSDNPADRLVKNEHGQLERQWAIDLRKKMAKLSRDTKRIVEEAVEKAKAKNQPKISDDLKTRLVPQTEISYAALVWENGRVKLKVINQTRLQTGVIAAIKFDADFDKKEQLALERELKKLERTATFTQISKTLQKTRTEPMRRAVTDNTPVVTPKATIRSTTAPVEKISAIPATVTIDAPVTKTTIEPAPKQKTNPPEEDKPPDDKPPEPPPEGGGGKGRHKPDASTGDDKDPRRQRFERAMAAVTYPRGELSGKPVWHNFILEDGGWKHIPTVGKVPEGAYVVDGPGSVQRGLQVLGKRKNLKDLPPLNIDVDTGAIDDKIRTQPSGKVTITSVPDKETSRESGRRKPSRKPGRPPGQRRGRDLGAGVEQIGKKRHVKLY